jgi:hypothetical protein
LNWQLLKCIDNHFQQNGIYFWNSLGKE